MKLLACKECTEYNEFKCFEVLEGRSNKQKWKTINFYEINFFHNLRQKSMFSKTSSLMDLANLYMFELCVKHLVGIEAMLEKMLQAKQTVKVKGTMTKWPVSITRKI